MAKGEKQTTHNVHESIHKRDFRLLNDEQIDECFSRNVTNVVGHLIDLNQQSMRVAAIKPEGGVELWRSGDVVKIIRLIRAVLIALGKVLRKAERKKQF